ncbi:MAG: efflux transporter outer membrane subunit [Chlorobiaceae bacterium]
MFFIAACSVGPDFVRPEAPTVSYYNRGGDPSETVSVGGLSQRFEKGVGPVSNWWQLFNSTQLDSAVTRGLANNFSLKAAQASLRQSQDNLRAGAGIFYPQINTGFGQSRQKYLPVATGGTAPASIFNLTTLSVSASYALDVFGGQRRAVEALSAQVDQQRALTLGTYIMLSGNIVNTFIAQAAYQAEIGEVEGLIAMQKEQISIAEKQFDSGVIRYVSILALKNQLETLEASLPSLQQKLSQAEHLLATLEGKTTSEWQAQLVKLEELSLPRLLPLSFPSELVRQRPDILAAEAQLHQASAGVGVATASLFPSFTLNASYGQSSQVISNLLDSKSNVSAMGMNVVAPVFNGGTLRSRKQAAIDAYQQSYSSYRQTVLAAFAQVADIVRALQHDAEEMQVETRALETALLSLNLIQKNYQTGLVNYLQVLTANGQYRQAKIGYLQAKAQQLQDTTALFVALGGGWSENAVENEADHHNISK